MQASDENDRGMDSAMSRVRIRPALNGLGVILYHPINNITIKIYSPIILLNSSNSTSFTPPALNTKPTAIKATTKKPISFENSQIGRAHV